MTKLLLALLMILSITAFASTSQPVVELNPHPTFKATSQGHDKDVVVQVIDARAKGFGNAVIDPAQNVTQVFTDQVNKALIYYGFKPNTANKGHTQLVVRILNLDYAVAKGYFGSNSETTVSASVDAKNASGTYSKTYMASAYSDSYLAANKQTPSDQVNTAVNQLLSNIFNDGELLQFLAG
jgi:uncharacterized lipoprotein YajG